MALMRKAASQQAASTQAAASQAEGELTARSTWGTALPWVTSGRAAVQALLCPWGCGHLAGTLMSPHTAKAAAQSQTSQRSSWRSVLTSPFCMAAAHPRIIGCSLLQLHMQPSVHAQSCVSSCPPLNTQQYFQPCFLFVRDSSIC